MLHQIRFVLNHIYIRPFDTEKEAKNFIIFIKTKFFRVIVSSIKITQSAPSKTYKFVPLEILDESSNINWDKSISDIDQQLYKKYKLTKDEIEYIENKNNIPLKFKI